MAYSEEIRALAVGYVRSGGSKAEAARRYGVTRATVHGWLRKGDGFAIVGKPGPKCNRLIDAAALAKAVKSRPDATLHELGEQFGVHYSSIHRALKRLSYSRKKNVAV